MVVLACASCATSKKETAKPKDQKEPEYVYYMPTGTHIPVRIRADLLPTSESQTAGDQQALRALQDQQQSQRLPKNN